MQALLKSLDEDGNGRYVRITCSKPDGFRLHTPGQYVELGLNAFVDDDGHEHDACKQYTVVAGCDDAFIEFMVKKESTFIKTLEKLEWHHSYPEEAILNVGVPMGGFDVSDVRGRDILCFAAGSGIAGIVPILRELTVTGDAMTCDVFYAETQGDFAYRDIIGASRCHLHAFKTEGVVSSNTHIPILGMIAKLSGHAPITFPRKPIVYACGPKDYVDRLRAALVPVFITQEDFRINL